MSEKKPNYLTDYFYKDQENRNLLAISIILLFVDYFLWSRFLAGPEVMIYQKIGFKPQILIAIIFGTNYFLSLAAYNKEKEISHLLLIANIVCGALSLILVLIYLTQFK